MNEELIVLEDDNTYFSVTPPGGLHDHEAVCCIEIGWKDAAESEENGGPQVLPLSEDGIRNLIDALSVYLPD